MTATRMRNPLLGAATLLVLAGIWGVAGWLLWRTSVPSGLQVPNLPATDYFTADQLGRADRYERFHHINWILSTLVLLAVLGWWALRGARFMRESAAGRIGTGMLLAMLGFALVWLVQLPFAIAGNWWDHRHGISEVAPWEYVLALVLATWLLLGAQFVFLSLSVVIVMGLAGVLGDRWWIPGAAVFVGLATLFAFVSPYLVTGTHGIRDQHLAGEVRRLATVERVSDVEVEVEDVDDLTSAANAYTTGLGPSRKVFLWNTLLDGRFSDREVRVVVAHEFGHQARNHIWKAIAWYALFALPGAWIIARATRRRGGMARPEAVPLSLLVLVGLSLLAQPVQNVISRHMEAEADWQAVQATRDPAAATSLFRRFSTTSLADPTPPLWAHVLLDTHPSSLDRIELAQAWKAAHPGATPLFPSGR